MKFLRRLYLRLFSKLPFDPKDLIIVTPKGVATTVVDPEGNISLASEANTIAYEKMVRQQGEVIEPLLYETAEDIAVLISNAACDHEYPRIIVYPVDSEKRSKVLELIRENENDLYPMYEYLPANVVNDDDLNSKTIIYKYGGKSHICKSV